MEDDCAFPSAEDGLSFKRDGSDVFSCLLSLEQSNIVFYPVNSITPALLADSFHRY